MFRDQILHTSKPPLPIVTSISTIAYCHKHICIVHTQSQLSKILIKKLLIFKQILNHLTYKLDITSSLVQVPGGPTQFSHAHAKHRDNLVNLT